MIIKKKIIKKAPVKAVVKKAVKKKPVVKSKGKTKVKPLARVKAIAAKVQKFTAKQKPIGKVVHYFDNIQVAVIKAQAEIKTGEIIRIAGGENTDFKQPVKSMQYNHQKIIKAKKGQEFGLKVKERVRKGYKVYQVKR